MPRLARGHPPPVLLPIMLAPLKAGALYGTVVFACGFALGTVRVLVVAPRLGEMLSVLLETPIILTISWIASHGSAARFNMPAWAVPRLAMGAMAFAVLQTAELGLSVIVFHRSLAEHLAAYRAAPGLIGLAGQVVFAGFPFAQAPRRWGALAVVRAIHTAIYLVMAASVLILLCAGIFGARSGWLWVPLGLVSIESVVFVGNGFKCPLSAIAVRYGASGGELFDTFLPERFTRHTFQVFGPLILLAMALLAARMWAFSGCVRSLWLC